MDIWEKSDEGRGNRKCKDFEVGVWLICLRNYSEVNEDRVEWNNRVW